MEPRKGIQLWHVALMLVVAFIILLIVTATDETPEPPPAQTTATESPDAARYRHDCENERYLAARRKLSDFTPQDIAALKACDQLGY